MLVWVKKSLCLFVWTNYRSRHWGLCIWPTPVQCTTPEGTSIYRLKGECDPGPHSVLHAQPDLASRSISHCKFLKESGNLSPSADFSTKWLRDPWQVPFLLCVSISTSVTGYLKVPSSYTTLWFYSRFQFLKSCHTKEETGSPAWLERGEPAWVRLRY